MMFMFKKFKPVCPLCLKHFKQRHNRQKFCCQLHTIKYHQLIKVKEYFKLSEEDLKTWKRLKEKK